MKGPSFIALHELFDRVADAAEEFADTVAERILALGGVAEGTVGIVGQRTTLPTYTCDITDQREHVEAISTALAVAGKAVRSSIFRAAELGDAGTADLFTESSRDIDKQLWFVESHLRGV